MKHTLLAFAALVLVVLHGCKSLSTDVRIPERRMPAAFDNDTDTTNSAAIRWPEHFNDPALAQLIDTALKNNPDLHMALQRIEAARAGVRGAKGPLFPEVGASVAGAMRRFGLYTMDGAGNITTEITPGRIVPIDLPDIYTGLAASWEIDIAGKLRNQRKAAVAHYLASVEGANYAVTNLVAEVANAYYDLVALDNELDVVRQTIAKQQEALDVVTLHKETGRANELAVQQFTAQVLSVQAMENEVQQRIRESENLVNFLLGRFPQPVERTATTLFGALPSTAIGVPSQLLEHRPDIRQAARNVEASRFALKSAKAEFYPNLTISAGYGYQAFDPQYLYLTPTSIAYNLLGNLTAPLINRNAIQANFRTAKAAQITALYDYQRTVLNGFVEVSNGLGNVANLQRMDSLRTRQSEVLTRSIETSTELYTTGRAEYLDVLFAQQNALQARLELIDTKRRQRFATVDLYRALGGGWR